MRTCATESLTRGEPLAATAATARTWLLVEQPGPWGAKALTASHLDPELGRRLDESATEHGARVALIRRPGPHPDAGDSGARRMFLAHTVPGRSWVLAARTAPSELDRLDFAALGQGDAGGAGPEWQEHRGAPLALVCTNGRRDRCCAVRGRPLAAELAASTDADVWEVTHLGGHRFAPTMLVLPHGYAYGRCAAHTAKAVIEAARDGWVALEDCRGRSAWERPGQAADLAVRELAGERAADAVDVLACEAAGTGRWSVTVGHADGRRWHVRVTAVPDADREAPASCGGAPGLPDRMHVESVAAVEVPGAVHTPGV
ncbi:sucrase ferredoxin [Streptomyces sp. TR06-5]|uniref:sucrase ferredoxin n=1 Tax=unclassified Streptomyces TaxID=2593676 RepID=UPI0039A16B41